jgi:Ala-tRNA(Pro) deacylase
MLYELLAAHGIDFRRVDHPPVYTCEQAHRLVPGLPGAETKNLFVCDGKGRRHFLVGVRPEARVDLKELGARLAVSGLRFASAQRLARCLGLEPGAVTLLAVISDPDTAVEVVIDEDLWREGAIQCHPLVNTSTLVLEKEALARFFTATGHEPLVMPVPVKTE